MGWCTAMSHNNSTEIVKRLGDFLNQTGDLGAGLLSCIMSYIAYICSRHYELSFAEREDVLQEVAMKLMCQGEKLQAHFSKRLLYVMVRNQCIDQFRKQQRQLAVFNPSSTSVQEVSAPAPSMTEGADISLIQNLNCLEAIFGHIESQPTGKADIAIYTHYAFGLSHCEIAARVQRTTGAITKRLSILKGHLKALKNELC